MLEIIFDINALRSASMGESLADRITEALRREDVVRIDFESVEIMTPSFANALVMSLLERFRLEDLANRCAFVNRTDSVIEMMNRAVRRYQSGIRLTTQLPASA